MDFLIKSTLVLGDFLFFDTKGIQWVDTDASDVYGPLRTLTNV